jgi:hypothetical protein
LKKVKNVGSLSPPSGAPRRIGAVADEERRRRRRTDKLDEALKAAPQVIERMLQA